MTLTTDCSTDQPKTYAQLLVQYEPRPITTEAENEAMLAVVDRLMQRDRTPNEDQLFDLLLVLIEKFEQEHYPIPDATPLEMLQFFMESNGTRQADLVGVIGSEGVVSEIVHGKRQISRNAAKALGEYFNVSYRLFL